MATVSVAKTPSAPPVDFKNEPLLAGEHTLPASWWTSEKIYDLEKRAIFYKSWMFTVHSSRFKKAGDYFSYTVAGINFFIIKNKEGELKAFHNVCRHRAYPVVRKDEGSSVVVGCKYHGWSYNTDGKLTKAPHFDNVEGFEKDENSLYPINIHTTTQGLVFVNFCQKDNEDFVPFDDWFSGLSTELDEFDFGDYDYHMSYELDGDFNWKTLMDGYQECYHCPTAHPGLSTAFKMETYQVVPKSRYCRHYAEIVKEKVEIDNEEKDADEESSWFGFGKKKEAPKKVEKKQNPGGEFNGLWVYLFPSNGVNCYSPAWYSIRVLPITATRTILHYDIYTKKGLDDTAKKEFVDFLQLVELEDFNLCQLTQKNLNEGVYSTGYLHPNKERGVVYYQNIVAEMVKKHFAKEQEAGKSINPAFVGHAAKNPNVQELEAICNKLECGGSSGESKLDW
ncbi:Rieske [2Fe-2S] iron-sulfur domain-containing protein [Scheffersomyces amazonensis]|uniref:Rieske [2Fe-2S] iron-sulfur domain-containing protein n=1 Tax=Scheffersomyces amazonensis TaxID=1078765 RepID=UPI00315CC863